jgi:hypothetical protein
VLVLRIVCKGNISYWPLRNKLTAQKTPPRCGVFLQNIL